MIAWDAKNLILYPRQRGASDAADAPVLKAHLG